MHPTLSSQAVLLDLETFLQMLNNLVPEALKTYWWLTAVEVKRKMFEGVWLVVGAIYLTENFSC